MRLSLSPFLARLEHLPLSPAALAPADPSLPLALSLSRSPAVQGWEQQLAGRGLKRAGETPAAGAEGGADGAAAAAGEAAKRRPSAKQVDKFRQQKEVRRRSPLLSVFVLVWSARG